MAIVVTAGPWATEGAVSAPAGASPGDVAFLVVMTGQPGRLTDTADEGLTTSVRFIFGEVATVYPFESMGAWSAQPLISGERSTPVRAAHLHQGVGHYDVHWQRVGSTPPSWTIPTRLSDGGGGPFVQARIVLVKGSAGPGAVRNHAGNGPVAVTTAGGLLAVGVKWWVQGDPEEGERTRLTDIPTLTPVPYFRDMYGSGAATWFDAYTKVALGDGTRRVVGSSLPDLGPHEAWASIELLPQVDPYAPTLILPESGAILGTADAVEFSWRHNPAAPGGVQSGYRLKVSVDGGSTWQWWTGSAWASSETTVASAASSVTVPAMVNDTSGRWSVETRDAVDGRWSVASSVRSFAVATSPTVTVTGPASTPEVLSPMVTWTPSTEPSAYQVRVVSGGTVVWDSGRRGGSAASLLVPVLDWGNGASYQAQVRIWSMLGVPSGWAARSFTMSWTTPPAPVVFAQPANHGVVVTVSSVADRVVWIESSQDGLSWSPVAKTATPADSGAVVVRDVLARFGVPTWYRARVATGDVTPPSEWAQTAPVVSRDVCDYIVSEDRSVWLRGSMLAEQSQVQDQEHEVSYGLGSSLPRVDRGPLRALSGFTVAFTKTPEDAATLREILSGARFWLRLPADRDGQDRHEGPAAFLAARVGPLPVGRLVEAPSLAYREVRFDWVQVA